ncbi:MAG TPA: FAA hydrolase family protein [Chloroflexi bacterium]|nr:FAA hydrolase family protein [Chloroflexota bacterium]
MKLLVFKDKDARERLGLKIEQGIVDVVKAANTLKITHVPDTVGAFIADSLRYLPALTRLKTACRSVAADTHPDWLLSEESLTLGPCVYRPEKLLCIGLNYRRHAAESGAQIPEVPVLFSKFNNALAGHGEPIPLPPHVHQYDYEVELAVVIGRTARYVSRQAALDVVLGYCTANDLSARDLQMRTSQWLLGKTLDGFCPIGPYLVTRDEVSDPQRLRIRSWLNGELRQDSTTADMVFSVAEIISYISQYITLKPGDVILTGTPEGVILGREDKTWMKPGDVISVEVEGLGRLTNPLVAESLNPR